jgi:hypothetical protein
VLTVLRGDGARVMAALGTLGIDLTRNGIGNSIRCKNQTIWALKQLNPGAKRQLANYDCMSYRQRNLE